jgi:hypothetical protein
MFLIWNALLRYVYIGLMHLFPLLNITVSKFFKFSDLDGLSIKFQTWASDSRIDTLVCRALTEFISRSPGLKDLDVKLDLGQGPLPANVWMYIFRIPNLTKLERLQFRGRTSMATSAVHLDRLIASSELTLQQITAPVVTPNSAGLDALELLTSLETSAESLSYLRGTVLQRLEHMHIDFKHFQYNFPDYILFRASNITSLTIHFANVKPRMCAFTLALPSLSKLRRMELTMERPQLDYWVCDSLLFV